MAWTINYSDTAIKQISKLGKGFAKKIDDYLQNRIANSNNPRAFGKELVNELSGLWRYRIEDYRIVCQLIENELTVLVLRVAHRSKVYG